MYKEKKVIIVIQARLSSSRLPCKAMLDLKGKNLLERTILQSLKSRLADEVWVATSSLESDDIVASTAKDLNILVYRGDLTNVLSRFQDVALKSNCDYIVRVTADNPLTSYEFIDQSIAACIDGVRDYLRFEKTPIGTAVEIVTSKALASLKTKNLSKDDLEHVTYFIVNNPDQFNTLKIEPKNPLLRRPDISVTVDTMEDYVKVWEIFNEGLADNLEDIIRFLDSKSVRKA